MKTEKIIRIGLIVLGYLFCMWLVSYLFLVPLTWQSLSFRWWVLVFISSTLLVQLIRYCVVKYKNLKSHTHLNKKKRPSQLNNTNKEKNQFRLVLTSVCVIYFIVLIILQIISSPMFEAKKYRNLINVNEEAVFEDTIDEINNMIVPIIDETYAEKLGDKKLGETKGLGSQFKSGKYSLIELNNKIYWVAPLEYNGFFKWMNKKSEGVPGYIKVSATNSSDVELVNVKMKYLNSAYYGQDLYRNVYKKYRTVLLDSHYFFEIDDENNPYFIINVLKRKINLTSGLDVDKVILVNAVNGEVKMYNFDELPDWVDMNITPDIIMNQLDKWARFIHGFKNTLFSKTEVMQVSEGYNYIYNNGNFYLMSGMTSVGSDESIMGITLTNMNTKATNFYAIGGATEWAAQQSAQGVVQDLGYKASFPILVNFKGIPTYFMTLKDDEGLIKRYAYVSIKDYSIVGIGTTLTEAQNDYIVEINKSEDLNPNTGEFKDITSKVIDIQKIYSDGTTIFHILLENDQNHVYIANYQVSLELAFTKIGDTVKIRYQETTSNFIIIESFNNENLSIVE